MERGKKMALLVGCNYPNTPHELRGCHNDVLDMRETLIARFGFDPNNVELLVDKPGSLVMPTGANIKKELSKMVDRAEQGDVLFFHYSGHGTLIKPQHLFGKEDEAIVPCDFNLITSVDFRQLVNRIPRGATFTILSDSCHSGGLIDKETEQIGPSSTPKDGRNISPSCKLKQIPLEAILQHFASITSKSSADIGTQLLDQFGSDASLMFNKREAIGSPLTALRPDEGILLSGCQTNETSADVEMTIQNRMRPCGAFSNAVQMALKEEPGRALTNREVVMMARRILSLQHFVKQHPCLYCSDENADAAFLGTGLKI